jgi:hypothetical protein
LRVRGQRVARKATITEIYATLPREVEVEARADAALIKGLIARTAQEIVTIGQALIRQKSALPHGSFLPWIDAEFDMAVRTAQNFMKVAEQYGSAKWRAAAKTAMPERISADAAPARLRYNRARERR